MLFFYSLVNSQEKKINSSLNKVGFLFSSAKQNNILLVEQEIQDLGFVGSPKEINQSIIEQIVSEKKVPVIAPLGLDKDNQVFNINADAAAGAIAKKLNATLEISPKIVEIFKDGQKKYGSRAWSSMIVKRMEDLNQIDFRAKGFPDELVDNEPEEKGYEI